MIGLPEGADNHGAPLAGKPAGPHELMRWMPDEGSHPPHQFKPPRPAFASFTLMCTRFRPTRLPRSIVRWEANVDI